LFNKVGLGITKMIRQILRRIALKHRIQENLLPERVEYVENRFYLGKPCSNDGKRA